MMFSLMMSELVMINYTEVMFITHTNTDTGTIRKHVINEGQHGALRSEFTFLQCI